MRNNVDDDVVGEKSQTVIDDEEIVEEEVDKPIVEEKVFESSYAAVSETAGLSEPSVMPSINDRCEMENEPSAGAKSGRDVVESTDPDVEDMVPDVVVRPSTEGFDTMEEPSVKDTFDKTVVQDDLLKTSNTNTAEGMSTNIPRVDDLEPTTEEACDYVDQGYTETLNEDVEVLIPSPKTKNSKKRKMRKMSEAGPSEPKHKLTRKEKVAKKARRAERRAWKDARRALRATEAHDTMEKEVEENVVEEEAEVIPPVVHTSVDDE
ncbi:hypothetical protein LIER_19136 [Lithospermum erythrorhizon]|uniref:Uncharacterized protein n=1 Tax=Lithospermum erythrorhizon TaxID=34254 RepID=A0AAV3QKJ5_LITER